MGFYTYVYLQLKLLKDHDLPSEVEKVLKYLSKQNKNFENEEIIAPDHPFFKCPRWERIQSNFGENFGYYDSEFLVVDLTEDGINHEEGEIREFVRYLKPYCDLSFNNGWIGWQRNEEADHITALFYDTFKDV